MFDPTVQNAKLQLSIDRLCQRHQHVVISHVATGHNEIDRFLGGGFLRGKLHEIIAFSVDDAASAAGFAAMCAHRFGGVLAWLQLEASDRTLHPHGLREIGINPDRCLFVQTPDSSALLRASEDAMRCTALDVVVIELWREPRRIDLTVSRRLLLLAERSGVTTFLIRVAIEPVPTAAQTRWAVTAAPSSSLVTNAPGLPTLNLELLRQRGGPNGKRWQVEWNREESCFRTPLSGNLAAVSGSGSLDGNRRYATG